MNRVILMGRMVADPDLKTTPSGVSVSSFRLAVDRNYQPKEAEERQADFIPCVAWRKTAEFICRNFQKGQMIAVEGELQSRNYEDKEGTKRTAYEVIVGQAYFTGSKADGARREPFGGPAAPVTHHPERKSIVSISDFEAVETDDGDLPF